ncbi:MAG: GNAT family N-acetyltransferase [Bacteroidales bacterium]
MYEVRIASLHDIPIIQDLFSRTILESNHEDYTQEQLDAWLKRGENTELWEKRIQNHYFIVAHKNNEVMGFASLRKDGYLGHLFVDKKFQKEGIGRLLVKRIEKFATRNEMFQIIADVSLTAKPFFEKVGFGVVKRQTVNIGIDVDNYLMQKNIG